MHDPLRCTHILPDGIQPTMQLWKRQHIDGIVGKAMSQMAVLRWGGEETALVGLMVLTYPTDVVAPMGMTSLLLVDAHFVNHQF